MAAHTNLLSCLASATLALSTSALDARASIVNGDFEAGEITGWTTSGLNPATFDNIETFGVGAHSGNWGAVAYSAGIVTMSQQVNTFANQWYILSFWVANDPSIQITTYPNFFSAEWNGQELMSITNGPAGDFVNHQFYVYSTDNSTPLDFNFQHPGRIWCLDDVTLTRTNIPTPGAVALLGLSSAIGGRRRRRSS